MDDSAGPGTMEYRRIALLLGDMLDGYDASRGLGSMSCSVYDTAWVACVSKPSSDPNGVEQWLFPTSFSYILDAQLPDGGWPAHPGGRDSNDVDGILSTLAALFCLQEHHQKPFPEVRPGLDLAPRIAAGSARASQLLRAWDVESCDSVGFEVLVPTLLELLEDGGVMFDFAGRERLLQIRTQKLARVRPEFLYQGKHFALLHSLEAFHRWEDFEVDRCAHQKIGGSMMASPSATASYLMRCSKWDDEAEAYLRLVLSDGAGKNSGGAPSAYPSTNFELIWVASTLLEAGVWRQGAHPASEKVLLDVLEDSRTRTGGLVGFAPGIEPDLDDSAKASIIFTSLGREGFTSSIVQHFDSAQCLKTYHAERTPSVSANCNALLGIVLDPEVYPAKCATVEKIVNFLCRSWSESGPSLDDKWNYSPYYPAMLISQCLIEVLRAWEAGKLPQVPQKLLKEKVLIVLLQCLVQTIEGQQIDGSWGSKGPREETAYALLILARLIVLPVTRYFRPQIISAIDRGREYLSTSAENGPEYLWVEKVSYGSASIAEAYIISALHIPLDRPVLGPGVEALCKVDHAELARVGLLIDHGVLSKDPRWLILASWIEARLCAAQLKTSFDGFQRQSGEDPYKLPAFQWTLANNRTSAALSSTFLSSMINCTRQINQISLLVDDAIDSQNDDRIQQLLDVLSNIIGTIGRSWSASETSHNGTSNGTDVKEHSKPHTNGNSTVNGKPTQEPVLNGNNKRPYLDGGNTPNRHRRPTTPPISIEMLTSYVDFFDSNPSLTSSGEYDRGTLNHELKCFILAQISHIEEQRHSFQQRERQSSLRVDGPLRIPCLGRQSSFCDIPAGLTGLPLTLAFANCLRAVRAQDTHPSVSQKLIARAFPRRAETIFLLEREIAQLRSCSPRPGVEDLRAELEILLSYEKSQVNLTFEHMGKLGAGEGAVKIMRMVMDVGNIASMGFQI